MSDELVLPAMLPAIGGELVAVRLERCIRYPNCAYKVDPEGNGICDYHRKQLAE